MSADRARAVLAKLRELERATQARDATAIERAKLEAIALMESMR